MPASDQQIQQFVNERVRPHAEQTRALVINFDDDISAVDDVYTALSDKPTWSDSRQDGPPHLLNAQDILAINAFWQDVRTFIKQHPGYPIVLKACVRTVGS